MMNKLVVVLLLSQLYVSGCLKEKMKAKLRTRQKLKMEIGNRMLEEYTSEESHKEISQMGGVFDYSGVDGLQTKEVEEEPSLRLQQKAKSAASLYIKEKRSNQHFEAYGCTQSDEFIGDSNWNAYVVLLMEQGSGEHLLVKACVQKRGSNDLMGEVAFVIGSNEKCYDRIGVVEKGKERVNQVRKEVQSKMDGQVRKEVQSKMDGMSFLQQNQQTQQPSYNIQAQLQQTIQDMKDRNNHSIKQEESQPSSDKDSLLNSFGLIQQQVNNLNQQITNINSQQTHQNINQSDYNNKDQFQDIIKLIKDQSLSIQNIDNQMKQQKKEIDLLKQQRLDNLDTIPNTYNSNKKKGEEEEEKKKKEDRKKKEEQEVEEEEEEGKNEIIDE